MFADESHTDVIKARMFRLVRFKLFLVETNDFKKFCESSNVAKKFFVSIATESALVLWTKSSFYSGQEYLQSCVQIV